jgi:hypothetical protein
MELELKHLAPYLPYKLKVLYQTGIIYEFIGPEEYGIQMISKDGQLKTCGICTFKPILRPLSDLVIDENLIEDFIGLGNWCPAYDEYIGHWYPDASFAQQAPYVIFVYFLVNHYDVFGLIEKGVAVDVNSINVD